MKKSILLLIIMLIGVGSVKSQSFVGKVIDKSGISVVGATVIAFDSLYNDIVITDADGKFKLDGCPNIITLTVSYMGYGKWEREIAIDSLTQREIEITLNESAMNIDEVVIRAKGHEIKKQLGKYVIDDIFKSPYAKGSNAKTFLNFIPMLNNTSVGVSILNKKAQALIYINGRPANMPLSSIPSKNVERIEIIATPGAEYGNSSKGGVINVILKRDVDQGFKLEATIGDKQSYYNSQNANMFLSYSSKKVNITANVSGAHNRWFSKFENRYLFLDMSKMNDVGIDYKSKSIDFQASLNLEYTPKKNQTWGFRISMSGLKNTNDQNSNTKYLELTDFLVDSLHQTSVATTIPFKPKLNTNISYDLKINDGNNSRFASNIYYGYSDLSQKISMIDSEIIGLLPTAINKDFRQNSTNRIHYLGFTNALTKNFNEDNTLKTGIDLYYFDMKNDLNYTQTLPIILYESNLLRYKDITGVAYASYDRVWSDIFDSSIGVRAEYHYADGLESAANNYVKRNDFDLLPFVSLFLAPHDNHEFSLDVSSSMLHPPLAKLNPFKYYSSSSEYRKENPNLASSPDIDVMFSYDLFEDYSFTVDYVHSFDSWTDFSIPDSDGNIVNTTANYGNSYGVDFALVANKTFFNKRWNINAFLGAAFNRDKGDYSDIIIDNRDWSYSFRLNNNIFLSKDFNWLITVGYKFSSQKKSTTITFPSMHSFDISLIKNFERSSISLNASSLLNNTVKFSSNITNPNYSFERTIYYYPTISLSYTYTFGNKKVRNVYGKSDSN
ncbi:MAG: outer membrane beta-barrel protein, partial [Rikenellaceae bacterium]